MKKIISPLAIYLPRVKTKDKRIALNLNIYRNLHHATNGQAKIEYCNLMKHSLENLVFECPIILSFYLYKPSKRKVDRANILSIVEKFFCDSLVHYGCIEDDNDNFIQSTHYYSGKIDKDNPRVEVFIQETKKEKEDD